MKIINPPIFLLWNSKYSKFRLMGCSTLHYEMFHEASSCSVCECNCSGQSLLDWRNPDGSKLIEISKCGNMHFLYIYLVRVGVQFREWNNPQRNFCLLTLISLQGIWFLLGTQNEWKLLALVHTLVSAMKWISRVITWHLFQKDY